jgi:nucleoside-diphosphate kinase
VERTLILIKPDAMARGLAGTILQRFENKGLKIAGLKMLSLGTEILKQHYQHLADKPFYPGLAAFMQSSPVIAICLEGKEAVEVCRALCGATNARKAAPGTIRGDLSISTQCNLLHASDSVENAALEIRRFFKNEELFAYEPGLLNFLLAGDER